jgi:hypothetical protein
MGEKRLITDALQCFCTDSVSLVRHRDQVGDDRLPRPEDGATTENRPGRHGGQSRFSVPLHHPPAIEVVRGDGRRRVFLRKNETRFDDMVVERSCHNRVPRVGE